MINAPTRLNTKGTLGKKKTVGPKERIVSRLCSGEVLEQAELLCRHRSHSGCLGQGQQRAGKGTQGKWGLCALYGPHLSKVIQLCTENVRLVVCQCRLDTIDIKKKTLNGKVTIITV